MTPLASLLAAVEAGPLWADDALSIPKPVAQIMSDCFDDGQFCDFASAYDGSINDAIALIEAMLPGWGWAVERNGYYRPEACVWHPDTNGVSRDLAIADTPARALLIAGLRALVDREGSE